MSDHAERRYLLAYDISDPRRRARVHRRVKKDGMALQYSLFDLRLREPRLRRLTGDLHALIDDSEDDVRIYGPRFDIPITWLGVSPFPPGVQLFNNRDTKLGNASPDDRQRQDRSAHAPSDAKGASKVLITGSSYNRTR